MSVKKGDYLQCRTKTLNNLFGIVVWKVLETGLPSPEKGREGVMDGVEVEMLGGSGPSAREGFTCIDSEEHIRLDITDGKTKIITEDQKDIALDQYQRKHSGTGVVDVQ